jgi:glycosyltransferase involved in cell wall biosynthesis
MKIWLITIGEPIPDDSENIRLYRTGILSKVLASRGHQVIWWNNDFNHTLKKHRNIIEPIKVNDNLTIRLIPSSGYVKNISFNRFYDHRQLKNNFNEFIEQEEKPDIILSSFPTMDLCQAAILYGKKHNVPVLIDIRDLWPDTFVDILPVSLKFIGRFIFNFLYKKSAWICKNATGIVAISPPILEWGLRKANRLQSKQDMVVYFGYEKKIVSKEDKKTMAQTLQLTENAISFCYIGNVSNMWDFQTIKDALDILQTKQPKFLFRFIVVGIGVALDDFKKIAGDSPNFKFTGYVNAIQIAAIMDNCDIGIVPYIDVPNFQMTISNKVIEYLSGGLAILTSVNGFLSTFLEEASVGLSYQNGNPESLANLLFFLSEHPEKLKHMRIKAFELYENRFQAEKVYNEYSNYLENFSSLPNFN